jgi:hypothetical protein
MKLPEGRTRGKGGYRVTMPVKDDDEYLDFDDAERVSSHQAGAIRRAEAKKWQRRIELARDEGFSKGWVAALAEARRRASANGIGTKLGLRPGVGREWCRGHPDTEPTESNIRLWATSLGLSTNGSSSDFPSALPSGGDPTPGSPPLVEEADGSGRPLEENTDADSLTSVGEGEDA